MERHKKGAENDKLKKGKYKYLGHVVQRPEIFDMFVIQMIQKYRVLNIVVTHMTHISLINHINPVSLVDAANLVKALREKT